MKVHGKYKKLRRRKEVNNNVSKPEPPTLSPQLVLKPLPNNLEYAFLGEGDTFPVVISSKLEPTQKENLVELLKKYKEAITWKLSDLKEIN